MGRVKAKEAYGAIGRSDWLDIDWEAHRRWIRVDGRWVNLIDIGEGPVLIFIHGLAGCWQNWLENIPFFARDHRVIAMDLPGFGESEMPADEISISGYGRTVEALCEALDIDSGVIIGNSMGGFIGAELAICFPVRVERLCLVGAAGLSIENLRTQRKKGIRHRAENVVFFNLAWIATRSPAITARPRTRRLILMLVAAHPERLPAELTAELVRGAGKDGFSPALDALCNYPIRDRLNEIACPTLIVWGDKDLLVPVKDAAEFERLIDDSRKVIYPDTGHLPMLERPARFNQDLRAFLEEQPGEEAPAPGRRAFAG
ncbi:MAG: alpha/beta hydrolase [Actinobacteria bacterium]|nr:alpha/beta hydrolase [Actinomycetota bacterium]